MSTKRVSFSLEEDFVNEWEKRMQSIMGEETDRWSRRQSKMDIREKYNLYPLKIYNGLENENLEDMALSINYLEPRRRPSRLPSPLSDPDNSLTFARGDINNSKSKYKKKISFMSKIKKKRSSVNDMKRRKPQHMDNGFRRSLRRMTTVFKQFFKSFKYQ